MDYNNWTDEQFVNDVIKRLNETLRLTKITDVESIKNLDTKRIFKIQSILKNYSFIYPEQFASEYYAFKINPIAYKEHLRKERKDLLDLKNSERIFMTYWWTFGLAVAAFLISLSLLILRLTGK